MDQPDRKPCAVVPSRQTASQFAPAPPPPTLGLPSPLPYAG